MIMRPFVVFFGVVTKQGFVSCFAPMLAANGGFLALATELKNLFL